MIQVMTLIMRIRRDLVNDAVNEVGVLGNTWMNDLLFAKIVIDDLDLSTNCASNVAHNRL
jgi:hypothetical protein